MLGVWSTTRLRTKALSFSPITAPACKPSGLKDARMRLKNSTVSGLITNLFSVLCVLIKILSHASVKKKKMKKKKWGWGGGGRRRKKKGGGGGKKKKKKRLKGVKLLTVGRFHVTSWQRRG